MRPETDIWGTVTGEQGGRYTVSGIEQALYRWQLQGARVGDTVRVVWVTLVGAWERHPLGHWVRPTGFWVVQGVEQAAVTLREAA